MFTASTTPTEKNSASSAEYFSHANQEEPAAENRKSKFSSHAKTMAVFAAGLLCAIALPKIFAWERQNSLIPKIPAFAGETFRLAYPFFAGDKRHLFIAGGLGAIAGLLSPTPFKKQKFSTNPELFAGEENQTQPQSIEVAAQPFKLYRQSELKRICAALKAGVSILVIGESGSGKSILLRECAEALRAEGYPVAVTEPIATKQLLTSICEQLEVPTETVEGKAMTLDQLKVAIADHLRANSAFLLLDDGQIFDQKFRSWLKKLVVAGQPVAVFATEAPKSDLFLALPPPLRLQPLPDYYIRDLMQQEAMKLDIRLNNRDFASLIPKAGGVPASAIALVTGEFIGVDNDGSPQEKGRDLTPLLLLVALTFILIRFFGLGAGNPTLYLIGASIGSVFLTIFRLIRSIPRDGRRIKP